MAQLEPGGPRGIYVYDLATGGIRTVLAPADDQYVHDVAWLPDGEHIIYNLRDGLDAPASSRRTDQVTRPSTRLARRHESARCPTTAPGSSPSATGRARRTPRTVVVRIDGDGEPVVLACGPGTDIECPMSWIWSPDDSMLMGIAYHETSTTPEPISWRTHTPAR